MFWVEFAVLANTSIVHLCCLNFALVVSWANFVKSPYKRKQVENLCVFSHCFPKAEFHWKEQKGQKEAPGRKARDDSIRETESEEGVPVRWIGCFPARGSGDNYEPFMIYLNYAVSSSRLCSDSGLSFSSWCQQQLCHCMYLASPVPAHWFGRELSSEMEGCSCVWRWQKSC